MNIKLAKHVCILLLPLLACLRGYTQEREIRGKVTDQSSGLPLPGVTVSVKGGGKSIATDPDGSFILRIPSGKVVLTFSYVGYDPVEMKAGAGSVINLSLAASEKKMDEVVVIGYGTVKKRDLTGAISVVKAADIVRSPTSNPLEAYSGHGAGCGYYPVFGKGDGRCQYLHPGYPHF